MTGRLEGKTAVVTGATSNIGRAIAEEFSAEGAHVVVSGRSGQRGSEVEAWLEFAAGDEPMSPRRPFAFRGGRLQPSAAPGDNDNGAQL